MSENFFFVKHPFRREALSRFRFGAVHPAHSFSQKPCLIYPSNP